MCVYFFFFFLCICKLFQVEGVLVSQISWVVFGSKFDVISTFGKSFSKIVLDWKVAWKSLWKTAKNWEITEKWFWIETYNNYWHGVSRIIVKITLHFFLLFIDLWNVGLFLVVLLIFKLISNSISFSRQVKYLGLT